MLCDRCKKEHARRFSAMLGQWLCLTCHDQLYKPKPDEEEGEGDDA